MLSKTATYIFFENQQKLKIRNDKQLIILSISRSPYQPYILIILLFKENLSELQPCLEN